MKSGPSRLALLTAITVAMLAVDVALTAALIQVVGVTAATPTSVRAGVGTVVTVTSAVTDPALIASSVNLQRLDSSGRVVATIGALVDDGTNGDATPGDKTFTTRVTIFEANPGPVRIRVSAAFLGHLTRVFSAPIVIDVTGLATGIAITSPANLDYLNTSPVRVTGTVGHAAAKVSINGVAASEGTGGAGTFTALVPILEGTNTLTAVATNPDGTTATSSVRLTLDTTPPQLTITAPATGYATADSVITVSGIVNDIVVGTVNDTEAQVDVNGVKSQVGNRSFLSSAVPLALGANTVRATARDRSGNIATATIEVTRTSAPTASIRILSGNGQIGAVGTVLPKPLVAVVVDAQGQPMAGVPVVFRITDSSGALVRGAESVGTVAVTTNSQGQAEVPLQVGSRAGVGNNIVRATATGVLGSAIFVASATVSPAARIVVDAGNSQLGVVGQPLPYPFIAVVTDAANNRLGGVPVTFTVRQGGGNFAGQSSLNTTSDSDGRVAVQLTLGKQEGQDNNVVEATFPGNPETPASFQASGRVPGNPADTRITGVVQDNSNTPIAGVTMRLFRTHQGTGIPEQAAPAVVTDFQGQFTMVQVPVGTFKLMADGSTATTGTWPSIDFDITTVAGQANDIGLPIYMPALDTVNRLCVTATTGGTLTLPQVPGFSLAITPGSATFPGGARSGCVTVTPVNGDKMPMAPGFGQQPRFLVTIQPAGTVFSPPAAITLPNVDNLAPRAVTEMYSYDHDLASFVAIGTGTVSEDGQVIRSDPGVGVLKAGWHCGGDPNPTGTAGSCAVCKMLSGNSCVADPNQHNQTMPGDKCQVCRSGEPFKVPVSAEQQTASWTFGPFVEAEAHVKKIGELAKVIGAEVDLKVGTVTGQITKSECCGAQTGVGTNLEGSVALNASLTLKGKLWPPGPNPKVPRKKISLLLVTLYVEAEGHFGVFLSGTAAAAVKAGYRKTDCSTKSTDTTGCGFLSVEPVTVTTKLSAEVSFGAALLYSCPFDLCQPGILSGEAAVGAAVSWPWQLGRFTYNEKDCDEGFKTVPPEIQPIELKVNTSFKGKLIRTGKPDESFEMELTLLKCKWSLSEGVGCDVVFDLAIDTTKAGDPRQQTSSLELLRRERQ